MLRHSQLARYGRARRGGDDLPLEPGPHAAALRTSPVSTQPETHYARSRDGSIVYQLSGSGPIDLVFIPWWATNIDVMWEEPSIARFLQRLASFSRLICFDKRGTGVSDPLPLAALPTTLSNR